MPEVFLKNQIMDAASRGMFGTGAGFGGSGPLQGSSAPEAAVSNFAYGAGATPGATPGDCHYFLQGTCSKVRRYFVLYSNPATCGYHDLRETEAKM